MARSAALLLFVSVIVGLWDMLQGFDTLSALIMFILVAVAIFNAWAAQRSN